MEVQRNLGFEVNTIPVGDLVQGLQEVTESAIDQQVAIEESYDINPGDMAGPT